MGEQSVEPIGPRHDGTIGELPYQEQSLRPSVRARFLNLGGTKDYLRGVTYGTFRPGKDGVPYPAPERAGADFAAMAAAGINAVRLYEAPPRWLLDLAHAHGLGAMVGLAWEQHVAFLDDPAIVARIERRVEQSADACAGHPAVLCFAIGNEIPSSIVRWHGARRIERFLERLYRRVKDVDGDALVTYANYPTTEYLQLSFLDVVSFNVYLESAETLRAYLARLHNLAGDRPLLITELGIDSLRRGSHAQARLLEQQLRATYASGCAGAFLFSWTDEWHRGGIDVDDWRFGLVDEGRRPKPALSAAHRAFAEVPTPTGSAAPTISVVVCSRNGAATIGDCLEAIARLDYPNVETIVVDDGSTDRTAGIAGGFEVRLIRTKTNQGLSTARNLGIAAATGEIVAFTDDDACPDPHWLRYLAHGFATTSHAGLGGPNVAPADGNLVERAVAHAPGGPIHVLLSDDLAEHVPGCNMAFRRDALRGVDGFDPQFRVAGDDVDICWRLQERGLTIGFCPGAVVTHRRRRTLRAYMRQQAAYGRAEALLERKWPEKYNRGGHLSWAGHMYGGTRLVARNRARIGYGTWGSNLFQSVYDRTPSTLAALPAMPEWYLVLVALAVASAVGVFVQPLVPGTAGAPVRVELVLLAAAACALLGTALAGARQTCAGVRGLRVRFLAVVLFTLQPAARLTGRLRSGLTPWRRRGELGLALPVSRNRQIWSERWRSHEDWLLRLERELRERCMTIARGGEFDRWDMHVRVGPLAAARVHLAVEEHGRGRQLVRLRVRPRWSRTLPPAIGVLAAWSVGAVTDAPYLSATLAVALLIVVLRAAREAGAAVALVLQGLEQHDDDSSPEALLEELVAPIRSHAPLLERRVPEPAGAEQHV
jgi:GT2 family glycosyltransferase